MNKLTNALFLAVALLLSQTAIALHEIHCLDEAHVESCEVCSAHDHAACAIVNQNAIDRHSYDVKPDSIRASVVNPQHNYLYFSRAPPSPLLAANLYFA